MSLPITHLPQLQGMFPLRRHQHSAPDKAGITRSSAAGKIKGMLQQATWGIARQHHAAILTTQGNEQGALIGA
jgi:hypothetical protein